MVSLFCRKRQKSSDQKPCFFCWKCPQSRFKAMVRNITVITREGFVLTVTRSPGAHCDIFPSGWGHFWLRALGPPTLDSWLFSRNSNTKNEGPKTDAIIVTPSYIAWSFLDIDSCLGPHHRALFIGRVLFSCPDPSGPLKPVLLRKYLYIVLCCELLVKHQLGKLFSLKQQFYSSPNSEPGYDCLAIRRSSLQPKLNVAPYKLGRWLLSWGSSG